MRADQTAGVLGVRNRDRKRSEALTRDGRTDVGRDFGGAIELANAPFSGDFPGGGRADQHHRRRRADAPPDLQRQAPVAIQPPEEGVSIQEKRTTDSSWRRESRTSP